MWFLGYLSFWGTYTCSAQHCLTVMIESMCKALDKGKIAAALLTDLSKAFDCILHDLLIAKMHAYGFNLGSLKLINSYLSNRKQRTKIDSSFISWAEIILGVPQGSILGPLLFNIYINDIFFFIIESDIANYADDNTLYTSSRYCEETILKLEKDANILIKWFKDNGMKLNEEKCKLLILSKKSNNNTEIILGNETIKNSKSEKLLGITIDEKLTDFTKQCSHPLPPTPTHSHPLPPTPTHSHPLPPTPTHSHPLPPTPTHSHPLPPTPTHSHPLTPTPTHSHPLPSTSPTPINSHSVPVILIRFYEIRNTRFLIFPFFIC